MRREFRVLHGKVWLEDGDVTAKLLFNPDNYATFTSQMACRSDRSRVVRASVRLACHTASGGSFLAICGGCFRPAEKGFSCRVAFRENHCPDGYGIMDWEADWLLQGVKLLGQYDAGILEIDEGWSNIVDSKQWAWERAGALLVRLVQSDTWDLADSELEQILRETAKYRPPVR